MKPDSKYYRSKSKNFSTLDSAGMKYSRLKSNFMCMQPYIEANPSKTQMVMITNLPLSVDSSGAKVSAKNFSTPDEYSIFCFFFLPVRLCSVSNTLFTFSFLRSGSGATCGTFYVSMSNTDDCGILCISTSISDTLILYFS